MNTIIIKIESGVVADVYSTVPIQVVVVDHDVIEGGEPFERRMEKAVLTMTPEQYVRPDEVPSMVRSLVRECIRPSDRQPSGASTRKGRQRDTCPAGPDASGRPYITFFALLFISSFVT